MRIRWVVFAMGLVPVIGFYVLVGLAFGWIVLVATMAFVVGFTAMCWAVARHFVKPS